MPDWLAPVTFGGRARPTEFALVSDEGRTVLRARAQASASGLARSLRVDPAVYPILAWRWKTERLVAKGRLDAKEGDDFALRLYVSFDLDPALLSVGDRMRMSLARALWGEQPAEAATDDHDVGRHAAIIACAWNCPRYSNPASTAAPSCWSARSTPRRGWAAARFTCSPRR